MLAVTVAAMGAATALPALIGAPLPMLALRLAVFAAVCSGPVLAWNRPPLVATPGRGWTKAAR
jgi:hypothetical protein